MPKFLHSQLLRGLPHGFSTSEGLASDDVLPGSSLVRVKQVHSPTAVVVEKAFRDLPEADALVTARSGLLLGIVTADCAPVLLADPGAGVVAAAHAGWRGAVGGVLENTVRAMISLGARPEAIIAAVGPTIARPSYEVDDAFRSHFADDDARFFSAGREGHCQFDLPAYVVGRLTALDVGQIEDLGEDTYSQPDRFFSFRRATHLSGDTGGRQLSVIGLPD